MDIRNIGNNGQIDRTGERGQRSEPKTVVLTPLVAKDDAQISSVGRATAAKVDQLAKTARGQEGDRDALVEAAREKLLSGELDTNEVFAATAENLANRGFLSV